MTSVARRDAIPAPVPRPLLVARMVLATFFCYLFGFLLTALGVVVGCVAALLRARTFIRVGTVVWARLLFLLVGRWLHLDGREHIAPGTAYVVVANHSSLFDIPAVMGAVPGVALMGRDYLARIPGFGRLLRILHYVPIDPASPRKTRAALEQAARTVREGTSVGIFAEGTRTRTGQVQELKRGFVHVLRASGCDLLPVSVRGTFALRPKGRLLIDPRERIGVLVGAPLPHARLAGLSDAEVMEAVRSTLQAMQEGPQ